MGKEFNTQFLVKLRLGAICIEQEARRLPHYPGSLHWSAKCLWSVTLTSVNLLLQLSIRGSTNHISPFLLPAQWEYTWSSFQRACEESVQNTVSFAIAIWSHLFYATASVPIDISNWGMSGKLYLESMIIKDDICLTSPKGDASLPLLSYNM